jgi:PAS domain S-box-containing protein
MDQKKGSEADLIALTRIQELSGEILGVQSFEQLLQKTMDAAVAIVGADRGTLQLIEGDSLRIVASNGHREPFLDFFASVENRASACGQAMVQLERVVIPDVEESLIFAGTSSLPVMREAGVRAVQSTPLVSRTGMLLGILTTQWNVPYTPDKHDLWRIDLLARQAADLIEHAQTASFLRTTAQFPQQNPNPVLRVDTLGRLLFTNSAAQAWLATFGWKPGSPLPAAVSAADAGQQPVKREISAPDGRVYMVTAIRPTGESYINLYGIEITEREKLTERLRESEERLRLAQEAAQVGAFEWNIQSDTNVWTPELEALYGLPPGSFEKTQKAWENLVHPDDRAEALRQVELAFETGQPTTGEWRVVWPDGSIHWIAGLWRVYKDNTGKPLRMTGMNLDISERKRAEEELRRLNENLENTVRERTATLVSANEELENRAEQLRRLTSELTMVEQRERKRLSKILHDGLQQYLVAARLQMEGLISGAENGLLKQSAAEVEHLLRESIKISRSLAAELSPPILHEAGILAGLEWLSRWKFEKYGLKVQLVMEMDAPRLSEDVKVLLFESVRELLLNVIKHAETVAAKVHLSRIGEDRLRIIVSDQGNGFDVERLSANTAGSGGFGLFSIRERIKFIGGEFEIDSSPGKGARFMLTAPFGASEPLATSPSVSSDKHFMPVPGAPCSNPRGKIRILLTDDHAVMREGLARLLGQEQDFEVVGEASDGREAVEKAAVLSPDVILMDISMPNLNGIDATRIIRCQHSGIRIIGLSLYSEDERAREMLEAGAAFYMTKSGPVADLKAAIRACMCSASDG